MATGNEKTTHLLDVEKTDLEGAFLQIHFKEGSTESRLPLGIKDVPIR